MKTPANALLSAVRPRLPASLRQRSEFERSLAGHGLVGIAVIAMLTVGLGGWAATTQIAGAVIAQGHVTVLGGARKVQHPQGGIVRDILVNNDDRVEAGQLLVQLDDVTTRADLGVVMSQLREAIAQQSRLEAERNGDTMMHMPSSVANWGADPDLAANMGEQEHLRQSRAASLEGQAARLGEQIAAKQASIEGLKVQLAANSKQLELVRKEGGDLKQLVSDGLVTAQRSNEMQRSEAELEGQAGSIDASVAAAQSSISELDTQRAQLYIDFRSQVLADLQTTSQTVAELLQKKIAAEDRLARVEIRAPISGIVHESIVQTKGGVVGAGDTLMLIVPQSQELLVEARVSPLDIDKLHVGQEALVRLPGFDPRTTPELQGNLEAVSPDLTTDPKSGASYYVARVAVPEKEQGKLPGGAKLVPGMPAETFLQTGDRTVMAYLLSPLEEQIRHTFRQ